MLNITKRVVGTAVEWTASQSDERGYYDWRVRVIGTFATIKARDEWFSHAINVALTLKSLAHDATLQDAHDRIAKL